MLDSLVQIDLIWLSYLLQNLLGSMSLLHCEDGICFCGRDGIWALDSLQLILLDKRRMRRVADINVARSQESHYILCTEAVADTTDFLRFMSAE